MRAMLQFGMEAKPKHQLKTGRTGQVHARKLNNAPRQDGIGVVFRGTIHFVKVGSLEELEFSNASEAVKAMKLKRKLRKCP